MPLPLSVLDLVPVASDATSPQALRHMLDLARLTDRLGYRRYWIAEHHSTDGFASSATAVLIGAVARETERIRVGSGGVMLPNHAPLAVAEAYLTLHALHPGRIDLGLGRAPGTDPRTALALRGSADRLGADDFPRQLAELEAFAGSGDGFPSGHPFERVSAGFPDVDLPPIWLLGSSTFGAQLAAAQGRGFAFAHHFSPDHAPAAMRAYRTGFRPSAGMEAPHAILAVSVVCAETEERADELARTHDLLWVRLRKGERGPLPTPKEAAAYPYTAADREVAEASRRMLIWGTPDTVRDRLNDLATTLQADELMIASHVASPQERLRGYELLAEAFGTA